MLVAGESKALVISADIAAPTLWGCAGTKFFDMTAFTSLGPKSRRASLAAGTSGFALMGS
jgi:hypothetical protein